MMSAKGLIVTLTLPVAEPPALVATTLKDRVSGVMLLAGRTRLNVGEAAVVELKTTAVPPVWVHA